MGQAFSISFKRCDKYNSQKIENEGFYIQKIHGYNLGHKFSRIRFLAMQIYYQCLHVAHMINQLTKLGSTIAAILNANKKFNF